MKPRKKPRRDQALVTQASYPREPEGKKTWLDDKEKCLIWLFLVDTLEKLEKGISPSATRFVTSHWFHNGSKGVIVMHGCTD